MGSSTVLPSTDCSPAKVQSRRTYGVRHRSRPPSQWCVGPGQRPEFRLEAPEISFINLPDSGPNLQKIRLKIPACS
eukprot:scaffold34620_cov69-Phaeocystis_antarctica.AAC.1